MFNLTRNAKSRIAKGASLAWVAAGLLAVPAATAGVMTPTVPSFSSHIVTVSDGGDCGYFTIVASSRKRSGVITAAVDAGARVIDRNAVDTFSKGYFAAAHGPNSKSYARSLRRQMRNAGFNDAYVKWGCEY